MSLHRERVRYAACATCGYDRRHSEVTIYPGCGHALCLRCNCNPPNACPVCELERVRQEMRRQQPEGGEPR